MRGSFRRWIHRRQHILEKAADILGGEGMAVGVRMIEQNAKMEVIFEEALVETLLNATGKARLVEALKRTAYVVQSRGGRALKASGVT